MGVLWNSENVQAPFVEILQFLGEQLLTVGLHTKARDAAAGERRPVGDLLHPADLSHQLLLLLLLLLPCLRCRRRDLHLILFVWGTNYKVAVSFWPSAVWILICLLDSGSLCNHWHWLAPVWGLISHICCPTLICGSMKTLSLPRPDCLHVSISLPQPSFQLIGDQTGFAFHQTHWKEALLCSHRCVFLTNIETGSCRDCPLACMWDVHSSIKPQLNSLLAYQPSSVEGYSITSCNSNNHFHSCSLSLSVSSACLSVSCRLQSTSGNWKWAIKCSQRSATWEARANAMHCPLIHYNSTTSPLLRVCVKHFHFAVYPRGQIMTRMRCGFVSILSSVRCNTLYSKQHSLCATLHLM